MLFFSDAERLGENTVEQSLEQAASDGAAQILSYLHLHLWTITRADVAEQFNYSERQITRIIEQATGMNFAAYLRKAKLEHIAEALMLSDYSVSEIVKEVGYQNNAYFYRHFRQMFGCTPQEYRKKNRPKPFLSTEKLKL